MQPYMEYSIKAFVHISQETIFLLYRLICVFYVFLLVPIFILNVLCMSFHWVVPANAEFSHQSMTTPFKYCYLAAFMKEYREMQVHRALFLTMQSAFLIPKMLVYACMAECM